MTLNRPDEYDLPWSAPAAPPAPSFAEQLLPDPRVVLYWEYWDQFVTATAAAPPLVSEWRLRKPAAGAWRPPLSERAPVHVPRHGVYFRDSPSNVLQLEGAAFPSGSATVLLVTWGQTGDTGNSRLFSNGATADDEFSLYVNAVGGRSITGKVGPLTVASAFTSGRPVWHLLSYDKPRRLVTLETMGSAPVSAVDTLERTLATGGFLGATNAAASGGSWGTHHLGVVANVAVHSSDPATQAGVGGLRDLLRRCGDRFVAAISAPETPLP